MPARALRRAGIVLVLALSACRGEPEAGVLAAAGYSGPMQCKVVGGIERTTMCGLILSNNDAAVVTKGLGLHALERPERIGQVTNIVELPVECRVLHFDNPRPMMLSGVFDSPFALHHRGSRTQFASVLLAREPGGQSCLTFVREFGSPR